MLGLKFFTQLAWIDIVNDNIKDIIINHAFCKQKAASREWLSLLRFESTMIKKFEKKSHIHG